MSSHPGGRKTPSRAVYLLTREDPLLLTDEHGKREFVYPAKQATKG